MATIWTSGRSRMDPISRIAWVPKPMQAKVIFSLGGTKPGPPRTCRGTMAKAPAAAPVVPMNCRRDTPRSPGGWRVAVAFLGRGFLDFIGLPGQYGASGRQTSIEEND